MRRQKKFWFIVIISLLMILVCSGCSNEGHAPVVAPETHVITDMGGRKVAIPDKINKVFCSNPIGTVDVYFLAPDKLAGWNFQPSGADRKYIKEKYLTLPNLGVWMGAGSTPNPEEIAKVAPDVIFCFWSADKNGVEMADAIQKQTGIPVILMDYNINSSPQVFRLLGEYLGVSKRADALVSYCQQTLDWVKSYVNKIPEQDYKSVYIAEGPGGLETDPVGSIHVQDVLDLLKLKNVANLPGTAGKGMGMPTISMEQLIDWAPQAILVNDYNMGNGVKSDLCSEIKTNSEWANLEAVRKGQVYQIPQSSFSWFGKPPSVVRILGCLWLLKVLYPEQVNLNLAQETKDFYSLFYQYHLSNQEVAQILVNAQ